MGMDLGGGETFPILFIKPKPAETPAQLLINRAGNKLMSPMKCPGGHVGSNRGCCGVCLALSLHWGWAGGFFSCASTGGEALLSKPTFPGSVVGDTAL